MSKLKINISNNILEEKIEQYSNIFPELKDSLSPKLLQVQSLLNTGILNKDSYDLFKPTNEFQLNMTLSLFRDDYINRYGFYLVSEDFLEKSVKLFGNKKILEVGAGSGFLSSCLEYNGLDIIATDKQIENNPYGFNNKNQKLIEVDSIQFLKENKNNFDVILMSWPDYSSNFADTILKHMKADQILIYIGESYGGCTANDNFFDRLEKSTILLENETLEFKNSSFSWFGIHDKVRIYQKL